MEVSQLDKALLPYEKQLDAQERRRRLLGVKEVDRPTYEKYIIGPIERFDRRKNAFMTVVPNNPFGEEIRQRFIARTGSDSRRPLPYSQLEPDDRIGQSLTSAASRLCQGYHPETLPVTPPEGRVEVNDKARMTRLIKKVVLFFGAETVRITKIDSRWVYQGIDIPHKYAILVVVSHVHSLINTAPSFFSSTASGNAYSPLKFITTQLADFICGLGYDATYRETVGPDTEMLLVPMAIDAGVGEFARNGRVLSPEFGINMRLMPVTTDLPLEVDKPISFGVHEFCMACENCASYCPSNAIPFGPPTDTPLGIYNNPGFRKWYVDAERCLTFWSINKKKWTSCGGRCIAVCPWNKPLVPFHNMVRWLAIHSPTIVKKMLVWGDKVVNRRTKKIKS
ncbi:MAG: reductive dehalogenase [Dehalococcoidales bacterium]|jgi:reductive dehalogenase|nr:reductive dehalogenase [Dehalococcoidales bacterium]